MQNLCTTRGIRQETTIPYTPQQNGKAERYNRTLETLVTALLHDAGFTASWWPEALATATFLLNRSPASNTGPLTRYQAYHGHPPALKGLFPFGSRAFVRREGASAFQSKYLACRFLGYGYDAGKKAWRFVIEGTTKAIYSRNFRVDERPLQGTEDVRRW